MWYCAQAQQFIACSVNQITTAMGLWMTGFCGRCSAALALIYWSYLTHDAFDPIFHINSHWLSSTYICKVCSACAPAHPETSAKKSKSAFCPLPFAHCSLTYTFMIISRTLALHVFDTSTWTLKQSIIPRNSVHPYEKNKYWRVSSPVVSILAIHPFQILHPFAGEEPGFLRRAFSNKDRAWTKEHVVATGCVHHDLSSCGNYHIPAQNKFEDDVSSLNVGLCKSPGQ